MSVRLQVASTRSMPASIARQTPHAAASETFVPSVDRPSAGLVATRAWAPHPRPTSVRKAAPPCSDQSPICLSLFRADDHVDALGEGEPADCGTGAARYFGERSRRAGRAEREAEGRLAVAAVDLLEGGTFADGRGPVGLVDRTAISRSRSTSKPLSSPAARRRSTSRATGPSAAGGPSTAVRTCHHHRSSSKLSLLNQVTPS